MALIQCHECKKEISSDAAACPHCGAKPRKGLGRGSILIIGLFAIFAAKFAWDSAERELHPPPPKPVKSETEKKADAEKEARFQLAMAAGQLLKTHAKDPTSFKMDSFLVLPSGAACYEYRAKNSFAAIVPAKAVFQPPGAVLTSEHDGNAFVRAWNKVCTQTGHEYGGSIFD
jgi:hypothetical protein